jgi:phenylalanyl-tRNA synthetase beta chain
MKISYQWLRDFVDVSISPSDLARCLTHAGLEVEDLVEHLPPFQGVVVAEVISQASHPNGGHLRVCQITDGHRKYSIVCGAPNVKEGQRVAFAREGARLPDGTIMRAIPIQGVLSEGMLCSEKELGIGEDSSGILILEKEASLGVPLDKALPIHDWVLDINVTPNRPDCLSVLGIAREVAALTGGSLRYPEIPTPPDSPHSPPIQTSVTLERPDLCPRYVAELILGVQIAPSPFWMRNRLRLGGMRPINNIVDITNYVMLELGQPLHAFDFDRLEERRIIVRSAGKGERFVTLDGLLRDIPEGALFICDGQRPVALAGIMGGLNSEVEESTTNILLESAYFDPMGIRRTSKRLGLFTEASTRFEKGVDPNGCRLAADRAASLMMQLAGGIWSPRVVDNYPRKIEPRRIVLRVERANQILGTQIPREKMEDLLQGLQLKVELENSQSLRVTVPTFRFDLGREIDLIEEIARLHGYGHIPETLPIGNIAPRKRTLKSWAIEEAKNLFVSFGFREVITLSFMGRKALEAIRLSAHDPRRRAMEIQNPLSEDQAFMRTTLIPGLLGAVQTNFFRQNFNLRFFELGKVFFARMDRELPEEIDYLSGICTGLRWEDSWAVPKEEVDFFDLKGTLQAFFDAIRLSNYQFVAGHEEPFLHPGKSCKIVCREDPIGYMGEIHPEVAQIFELKQKIYLFELNFDLLVKNIVEKRNFRPLPKFPAVYRDLALVVEEGVSAGDLLRAMEEANDGLMTEVGIFDLYRGSQIPAGKKSLAFRLKYQSDERTLTDEEVNASHQRVIEALKQRFGAVLR